MEQKKRRVVSYENMDEVLAAAFNEKYPKGFSDYLPDLKEYPKPDGTSFYAVTVETEDAICLVKIKIKTDDVEDIERWLDSEDDDEGDEVQETIRLLFRTTTFLSTQPVRTKLWTENSLCRTDFRKTGTLCGRKDSIPICPLLRLGMMEIFFYLCGLCLLMT